MTLHTASDPSGTLPSQSDRQLAVQLENVSVRYWVPHERIDTFKEYVIRVLQRRVDHSELWALTDIDLQVRRGEAFGIIGPNGAGKSTLLKLIAGVLRPTLGRVWVRGQVAPLLDIGGGFHPELTGRENVYLNATLLGHARRDISARFEQIVDFAELWDFIDAPLRTYSTGMAARLGFAVAVAWEPDVLLVDEVLAVGDQSFQQKCLSRMDEFRQQMKTIVFVSHSLLAVQTLCDRACLLSHGRVVELGDVGGVLTAYEALLERQLHGD
jgi:ABC-type polysaccharide/polyol phosphate transport system ATPase subunit